MAGGGLLILVNDVDVKSGRAQASKKAAGVFDSDAVVIVTAVRP